MMFDVKDIVSVLVPWLSIMALPSTTAAAATVASLATVTMTERDTTRRYDTAFVENATNVCTVPHMTIDTSTNVKINFRLFNMVWDIFVVVVVVVVFVFY